MLREFQPNSQFDWHTAPQQQYVVYLNGEVEVEASCGDKRVFQAGDILLASDLHGQGHATRAITRGRSIIVTAGGA